MEGDPQGKEKNQDLKKREIDRKICVLCAACIAAGMLAGGVIGYGAGARGREQSSLQEQSSRQAAYYQFRNQMALLRAEASREAMEAAAAKRLEEKEKEDMQGPELTGEQRILIGQIEEALEEDQMDRAAELMIASQDQLWTLYEETMGEQEYLFREGHLYKELDGEGLVLRKPSLVFLGSFRNGKPEGKCLAFQAIEMDYPRYDYAEGNWKDGKMDGEGVAGYCYYEGAGEENRAVSREGNFTADRMNGRLRYSTTNAQNETTVWNMTAEDGKLVLDEEWSHDREAKVYQLRSEQDSGHAYVISEEAASETRFQNLLVWE